MNEEYIRNRVSVIYSQSYGGGMINKFTALILELLELEKQTSNDAKLLEEFRNAYFVCPDCGYKVSPTEFLTGGDIKE